jgi:hypothetical protein
MTRMRKKLFVSIFIVLTVILVISVMAIPALAKKDKPEKADGIWLYTPDFSGYQGIIFQPYFGNPDTTFAAVPYDSEWSGIFNGTSKDYGLAIFHGPAPMLFVDAVTFDEVEVGGASGGLEMDVLGDRPDVDSDWRGTWVITSGTGELEDLRGHGTWWGPGWLGDPAVPGVIYYVVDDLDGIDFKDKD